MRNIQFFYSLIMSKKEGLRAHYLSLGFDMGNMGHNASILPLTYKSKLPTIWPEKDFLSSFLAKYSIVDRNLESRAILSIPIIITPK